MVTVRVLQCGVRTIVVFPPVLAAITVLILPLINRVVSDEVELQFPSRRHPVSIVIIILYVPDAIAIEVVRGIELTQLILFQIR